MEMLCVVCLSSDRKLLQIPRPLVDIIKMILPELEISKLCWECLACIRHLFKLRQKALKSKEILDKHLKENSLDIAKLQSSTNLQKCYIFSFSLCGDIGTNLDETKVTNANPYLCRNSIPKNPSFKLKNKILNEVKESHKNDATQVEKTSLNLQQNAIIASRLPGRDELKGIKRNVKQKKVKIKRKRRLAPFKQYSCSECKKTFQSRGKYEYHRQKHRGRVQCSICSRDFSSRSALTTHHNVAHTATPWVNDGFRHYCQPCAKFFKTSCGYRKHVRTSIRHVDPETLRYPCPVCNKRFDKSQERNEHHERIHLKRNKLQCPRCSRQYCSVRALRSHMRRRHTAMVVKRDFVCEICGGGFTTAQVLKGHQHIHKKEKTTEEKTNNTNSSKTDRNKIIKDVSK